MPLAVKDAAVTEILTTLMPAWKSHEVASIRYLPGGYTNRNYRVEVDDRAYVLRVVEQHRARDAERDYLALDVAPDVVAYDSRHGHLLTRWIDGRILADAPPTPEEAGEYLAHLHARIPMGLNRYDFTDEVSTMFRRARHVDAAVRDCFERIAWRPMAWRGCHNDLNPWNIIRTQAPHCRVGRVGNDGGSLSLCAAFASGPATPTCHGTIAPGRDAPARVYSMAGDGGSRFRTLDWESAGDNDPLFDLVGLCVGLGWGIDEALACHDAYREGEPRIGETATRLADTFRAFLIREYAWAVAQLATGNDREGVRQQVATSREALAAWR